MDGIEERSAQELLAEMTACERIMRTTTATAQGVRLAALMLEALEAQLLGRGWERGTHYVFLDEQTYVPVTTENTDISDKMGK